MIATVAITILVSVVVARAIGFRRLFGLLTGGATAICGASAALALAAALPAHPDKERATLFTVIGVSALSTLAMIAYPMIVHALDLGPQAAGVFLGATIHDVAQVVGAGYGMSQETGDTATVVKLMRIAMLLPVIVCAAMITRASGGGATAHRPPLLPWFAVAFIVLATINSTGWAPPVLRELGSDAITLVSRHRDQCNRHEDRAEAARQRRPSAGRADDRRNGIPRAARAGAAALGLLNVRRTVTRHVGLTAPRLYASQSSRYAIFTPLCSRPRCSHLRRVANNRRRWCTYSRHRKRWS